MVPGVSNSQAVVTSLVEVGMARQGNLDMGWFLQRKGLFLKFWVLESIGDSW